MVQSKKLQTGVVEAQPAVLPPAIPPIVNPTGFDTQGNPFAIPNVQVQPTIQAGQIVNPPQQVQVPVPKIPTPPAQFVQRLNPAIQQSNQGLITAQTREAESRNDVLNRLLSTNSQSTQGVYDSAFQNAGGDDFLKQFTDANTKLAQLQGRYNTVKQQVSGARGQSQVQEGFALNDIGRQEAVEVGNQALVVQAMQGNVETARQIALDTTRFANEDRLFQLNNLTQQYDALNGIVTGQEAQLIEQAKQKAEAEKEELKRLQTTIDAAITSGGATADEMVQLSDTNMSTEDKLAFAQSIIARIAGEDRQIAGDERVRQRYESDRAFGLQQQDFEFQKERFIAEYNLDLDKFSFDQQQALIENSGEPDKALSAEELIKFGGLPAGTTWGDVTSAGLSPEKPASDSQRQTAGYAQRIEDTINIFNSIEGEISKFGSTNYKIQRGLPNWSPGKNKYIQQQEQAERNFINAVLRRESGATITPDEFSNAAQQYLPQPGDKPEVLAQKKANRDRVFSNFKQESGSAWSKGKSLLDLENSVQGNVNEKGGLVQKFSSRFKQGSIGGQCGTFAHKLVNFPSVGDPIAQKFASVRKYGQVRDQWAKAPRVGDVIITNEHKTYGHVAVVNKILPNGMIQLSESNYAKPNTVTHTRTLAINSPKIYGAIKGTPIA